MSALLASPYIGYIAAAYGAVILALGALSGVYIRDWRRQKRRSQDIDRRRNARSDKTPDRNPPDRKTPGRRAAASETPDSKTRATP